MYINSLSLTLSPLLQAAELYDQAGSNQASRRKLYHYHHKAERCNIAATVSIALVFIAMVVLLVPVFFIFMSGSFG